MDFFSEKPKGYTLHDLYPNLFDKHNKSIPNLNPEQKQKAIVEAWKSFLS